MAILGHSTQSKVPEILSYSQRLLSDLSVLVLSGGDLVDRKLIRALSPHACAFEGSGVSAKGLYSLWEEIVCSRRAWQISLGLASLHFHCLITNTLEAR